MKNGKRNKTSNNGEQAEAARSHGISSRFQLTETNITGEKDIRTFVQALSEGESETISDISDTVRESPKSNSVEIQTSFIDANFQRLSKDKEYDSDKVNEQDNNILEDLDISWKDRVEPFIRNNFHETKTETDFKEPSVIANELHLDLETDVESIHSHGSSKRSNRASARDERSERLEALNNEGGEKAKADRRLTGKSDRSERSQSSSGQRFDRKDEAIYRGQRSSRSEERSSRSNRNETDVYSAKSPTECDRHSQMSGRSNRSCERGHDLNDTERFSPRGKGSNSYSDQRSQRSNQSGQLSERSERSEERRHYSDRSQAARSDRLGSARSHKSDGVRSHRSEDVKSHRSEDAKSHRSEGPKSNRSEGAKSHRSGGANSYRSNGRSEGAKSHRSDSSEGRQSQKSERSQRSRKDEGQRSHRKTSEDKMVFYFCFMYHIQQSPANKTTVCAKVRRSSVLTE